MLKVRLRRMGPAPALLPDRRLDSRLTARAKVLEELGSCDPVAGADSFSVNRERADFWIGAARRVEHQSVRCSPVRSPPRNPHDRGPGSRRRPAAAPD